MNLREKKHVSGELGMSSMTDIIFILLMFFMMTSVLVHPSALNLNMPGNPKTTKKPISKDKLDDIAITASGAYLWNGRNMKLEEIRATLTSKKAQKNDYSVLVSPSPKAPIEFTVAILDMTQHMNVNSIYQGEVE
jgi:biopolymer transport protein ExbD